MGYNIHITRAESWLDDETPITLEEIEQIWDKLPEGFQIDRSGVVTANMSNGSSLSVKVKPYLIFQNGDDEESRVHIYFDNGAPEFCVHDEMKMLPIIELADLLGAKVQGDEDEIYTKEDILKEAYASQSVQEKISEVQKKKNILQKIFRL